MLLNLTVLGREATTPAAKKTFRGQIISPKEGGGERSVNLQSFKRLKVFENSRRSIL